MKASFKHHLTEERRLAILRLLASSAGYAINAYTLEAQLNKMAHHVDDVQLGEDVNWLCASGLATQQGIAGVTVVTLTRRGFYVAQGQQTAPGVAQPMPD